MQLELFYGQASSHQASVGVATDQPAPEQAVWQGTVYGPFCEYAQTLPARVEFRPTTPDSLVPCEAVLPDPCFWTPESPYWYEVKLQARQGDRVLGACHRTFGIRPLTRQGRHLMLAGRRHVFRGARRTEARREPLAAWREAGSTMLCDQPDDTLCQQASQLGIMLLAQVPDAGDELQQTLWRLSRWPAVGLVILTAPNLTELNRLQRPRNLLLGQPLTPSSSDEPLAGWADVIVCPADSSRLPALTDRPVIACWPGDTAATVVAARRESDRLQRDLAATVDLAGYIVL